MNKTENIIKSRIVLGIALVLMTLMLTSTLVSAPLSTASAFSWLKPATIILEPQEDTNIIKTQHTFIATVLNANGKPLEHELVVWTLSRFEGAVGDIVEVDRHGYSELKDSLNAVTTTNEHGKTWITITATRPGDTDVIAYCPGIKDATNHKVFATKHWIDWRVEWPEDAVNTAGTEHTFTTRVIAMPNGEGVSGLTVKWTIVDDVPDVYWTSSPTDITITSVTDVDGYASATLAQTVPASGENTIKIEVLDMGGSLVFENLAVKKTWTSPAFTITKTGPATAVIMSNVDYVISMTNIGDGLATSVVVTDTIPAGMSYVSSTPAGTVSGNVVTWSLGDMAPGATATISLTLKANEVGTWTNTVMVTCAEGVTAEASATTVVDTPTLSITKTGPAKIGLFSTATYTIIVKNPSAYTATSVVVTDTIPAGMSYVSSNPAGTVSGSTVTWNLGTMAPGATATVTLVLKGEQVGTWTNTVNVVSAEGATAQASATTIIEAPTLSITKTGPATLGWLADGTYTITVKNTGAYTATSVVVTDTIPAGMTYKSSIPAGTVSGSTVTWNLGTMAPGATSTIIVVVEGTQIGTWTNTVNVVSAEGATAQASFTTVVTPLVSFATVLTDTVDPVPVGSQTTYIFNVTNQGIGQATAVGTKVWIKIPTNTQFVSASGPSAFTFAAGQVTFDPIDHLEPGDTLTYKVTVQALNSGFVSAEGFVTATNYPQTVSVQEGTTLVGSP